MLYTTCGTYKLMRSLDDKFLYGLYRSIRLHTLTEVTCTEKLFDSHRNEVDTTCLIFRLLLTLLIQRYVMALLS